MLGSIISLINLLKMIYGQGKAKARENYMQENLQNIDLQLTNHIKDLGGKVDKVDLKIDESIKLHSFCRQEMEGRVSKIEGKLNGLK